MKSGSPSLTCRLSGGGKMTILSFGKLINLPLSKQTILPFSVLISMLISMSACGLRQSAALTPVSVQLSWTHQAQFAGFYAADQKGYYGDEGLAVTFLEGGPSMVLMDGVVNGKAQFGVLPAEQVILARASGQPVKAIGAVFQRSPRVYVALAGSGIRSQYDFAGKTISINKGGLPLLLAMMKRIGITPEQYNVVDNTADMQTFYDGKMDVRSVYLTNEVVAARNAGYHLNIIYPDDYGIHNYADTIYTTDALIAANPELALRFLRATLKGWTYAIEHPQEAGALVTRYQPETDGKLENDKMAASLPLVNNGEDPIGWMQAEIWNGMEKMLREQGVLTQTLDVQQTYTMQFLDGIYK
jgi:NitT/TauT family transport system substrate-binding protein